MIARGIREYVGREWRAVRDAKDRYWAERILRLGASEGLRIAGELWHQARQQNPHWPSTADRRADLIAHVRLTELFARAGSLRRP